MAIPDALSRAHIIEYGPEKNDPAEKLLGSIFNTAYTLKNDEQQSLMKQAELRKSANLQPGQDVFGDTGRIRLLMLPALVKESNSNGGNIDQDIVMDNDLAYAQRLDPYWNEIIEYKQFHKLPQTRSRAAFVKTSMYKIDDRGILRRLYTLKKGSMDDSPPAVLPAALYDEVLYRRCELKILGRRRKRGLKFVERKKCRIFILFRFGRGYIEYNHIREAEWWKRSELSRFHGFIKHD